MEDVSTDVVEYYTGRFFEHGATHAGVDWNSAESQELRFTQLLRIADGDDAFSLNDYGCGYGALRAWLDTTRSAVDYRGFDLSGPMVDAARGRFGERDDCHFNDADDLEIADYTVASGLFNVKLDADVANWEAYVDATLARLAVVSRKGFAFNMLTSWSDTEHMRDHLYYPDPCRYFDVCKRRFSRQVALLHDYGLYEFTILVRL